MEKIDEEEIVRILTVKSMRIIYPIMYYKPFRKAKGINLWPFFKKTEAKPEGWYDSLDRFVEIIPEEHFISRDEDNMYIASLLTLSKIVLETKSGKLVEVKTEDPDYYITKFVKKDDKVDFI